MLKAAYVQGRLSKDEFDLRVSQALGSRTWAELVALTTDIPVFARAAEAVDGGRRPWAFAVSIAAMASIGLVLSGLLAAPPSTRPARGTPIHATDTGAEQRVDCSTPWRPPSTRLPARFAAVAAVECIPSTASFADIPQGHLVFIKREANHGLAPLVAALRQPSSPPSLHTGSCPLLLSGPVLFVVSRGGQVIRPNIPTGLCGIPLQQVETALQLVPWVTVGEALGRAGP